MRLSPSQEQHATAVSKGRSDWRNKRCLHAKLTWNRSLLLVLFFSIFWSWDTCRYASSDLHIRAEIYVRLGFCRTLRFDFLLGSGSARTRKIACPLTVCVQLDVKGQARNEFDVGLSHRFCSQHSRCRWRPLFVVHSLHFIGKRTFNR